MKPIPFYLVLAFLTQSLSWHPNRAGWPVRSGTLFLDRNGNGSFETEEAASEERPSIRPLFWSSSPRLSRRARYILPLHCNDAQQHIPYPSVRLRISGRRKFATPSSDTTPTARQTRQCADFGLVRRRPARSFQQHRCPWATCSSATRPKRDMPHLLLGAGRNAATPFRFFWSVW